MGKLSDFGLNNKKLNGPSGLWNYFGTGADGAYSSSGNTTLTATANTGYAVGSYTSFTLNAGHIFTVNNPCRGLIIRCLGDVVIAGTLHMNEKGGLGGDYQLMPIWEKNSDGTYCADRWGMIFGYDIQYGGAGGNGGYGGKGAVANTRSTGGTGGSGRVNLGGFGGQGGGGCSYDNTTMNGENGATVTYPDVAPYGGGRGGCGSNATYPGTFLSTNVGGFGYGGGGGGASGSNTNANKAGNDGAYAGGLIIICARGSVTVNGGGVISCNGGNGGGGVTPDNSPGGYNGGSGGGGGAGGGVIKIYYTGDYTNSGTVQCAGGSGGAGGGGWGVGAESGGSGSSGSAGTIITQKII